MMSEQQDLPPGAEQIGPFIFVPLEEPPGEEFARIHQEVRPRFWMEEQTGLLADAVESYFTGERLLPQQLEHIKLYLRQYLERAVMTADADRGRLLQRVEGLRSTRDIERLADELSEYGVEPF